jgi:hypothetical protein
MSSPSHRQELAHDRGLNQRLVSVALEHITALIEKDDFCESHATTDGFQL